MKLVMTEIHAIWLFVIKIVKLNSSSCRSVWCIWNFYCFL